jgi:hypothetical protein
VALKMAFGAVGLAVLQVVGSVCLNCGPRDLAGLEIR